MDATTAMLAAVADALPDPTALARHVLVGIDGVDGSGKTTFADELASVLAIRGERCIRISLDEFHAPRAVRHRRGRDSPEGFWLDSYDFAAFRERVLIPLGPSGTGRYRAASHDLETDLVIDPPELDAGAPCTVIVDGLFLQRDEFRGVWDVVVFLDVEFAVSVGRMARRDGSDVDPAAASNRRYVEGQRIYFRECDPQASADILIDHNDIARPRVVRRPGDEEVQM
ncbi:MAG TPA: uridine kinase [Pseudolysinimonas sp.]|nr:uridine kinase [Pseudolysinimonas sp.]